MPDIIIKKANMFAYIGRALTKKQIEDVFLDCPQDGPHLRKKKTNAYLILAYIYDFHTGAQVQTLEAAGRVFNLNPNSTGLMRDYALQRLINVYQRGYRIIGKEIDYA